MTDLRLEGIDHLLHDSSPNYPVIQQLRRRPCFAARPYE
jgi:hypothetical protein